MMNLLEPVVLPVQSDTSHAADPIPAEVAQTPGIP